MREPIDKVDEPRLSLSDVRKMTAAALTRAQTAQLFKVDPRTITRAIEDGSLPHVRLGRRVLIPREPLLRLLDTSSMGLPPAA